MDEERLRPFGDAKDISEKLSLLANQVANDVAVLDWKRLSFSRKKEASRPKLRSGLASMSS